MTSLLYTQVHCLHGGQVLLMKRHKEPNLGLWVAPGGKIEPHESPYESAARELYEETGLVARDMHLWGIVSVVAVLVDAHSSDPLERERAETACLRQSWCRPPSAGSDATLPLCGGHSGGQGIHCSMPWWGPAEAARILPGAQLGGGQDKQARPHQVKAGCLVCSWSKRNCWRRRAFSRTSTDLLRVRSRAAWRAGASWSGLSIGGAAV